MKAREKAEFLKRHGFTKAVIETANMFGLAGVEAKG